MQHGADIQEEVAAKKFSGGAVKENGLSLPILPKQLIRRPKTFHQKMGEGAPMG
jgi:hypothetical protein